MAAINPYLTFDGDCEEAFLFYQSVFGTEIPFWSRFSDAPPQNGSVLSEGDANKIMHVSLDIGEGTLIMGSDVPAEYSGEKFIRGNNIAISVNTQSREEAEKIFNGLSSGGNITMPLQETFWGAFFGMWTDKFGIPWMVNYDDPEKTKAH